jgi:hypothetical protein
VEVSLHYHHCEIFQSFKLLGLAKSCAGIAGTFVADARLRIQYTPQQHQRLLSHVVSEE